jgi:alpha-tubulin suppressor-like RCC1 family protein
VRTARILSLGLSLVFVSCELPTDPIRIATITVSPSAVALDVGQELWLSAAVVAVGGAPLSGQPIAWTVSPSGVAAISAEGKLVGTAPGVVTVTASSDTASGSATFTIVSPPSWASMDGGFTHHCAITTAGATWCWGQNQFGQLGAGATSATEPVAVQVAGGPTFAELSLGIHHSCGRTAAGAVHCWGRNDFGQLGDSSLTSRNSPVRSGGTRTFNDVARGSNRNHSCWVANGGNAIECWGAGFYGQLGTGDTLNRSTPFVASTAAYMQVVNGHRHTCARQSDGAAVCWGSNAQGRLGDGTDSTRLSPVPVSGGHLFEEIGSGFQHTCGRKAGGSVYCWGDNAAGQLGNGSVAPSNVPVLVSGGYAFDKLFVMPSSNCGVTAANVTYCWGLNDQGQLNDGSITNRSVPVAMRGSLALTRIAGGLRHTCGLSTTGAIHCWGGNVEGQLGDGGTTARLWAKPITFGAGHTETWTANVGTGAVTMRLKFFGGTFRGEGTIVDPTDPPPGQFTLTGVVSGSSVTFSLQPQPVLDGVSVADANASAMPFIGQRTGATVITGTLTMTSGNVALTLIRQ